MLQEDCTIYSAKFYKKKPFQVDIPEQERLQNKQILFPRSEIIFLKQQWLRGPGHNFLTGQWINYHKSMN